MYKRLLTLFLAATLLVCTPALAQNDDKPVIAILRLGSNPAIQFTEDALISILQSYGFISATEE